MRETTIPVPARAGTFSSGMPVRFGFVTSRFARASGGISEAWLFARSSASFATEIRNARRTATITRITPSTPNG